MIVTEVDELVAYWEMLKAHYGGGNNQMTFYMEHDNRLYDLLEKLDKVSLNLYGNTPTFTVTGHVCHACDGTGTIED